MRFRGRDRVLRMHGTIDRYRYGQHISMKFSEKWLREWVNPEIDTQKLVHQVTMAGLEVDGVEQVAGSFTGVVVGHVLSVEKHPDAEKLSVCRVTNGQDEFQVVCGAPNVRANLKVPFAMIGAVLRVISPSRRRNCVVSSQWECCVQRQS